MKAPYDTDIAHYPFFKRLIEFPFVDAIYVFGSRATPDFDDRSDLDLAVICPDATTEEWEKLQDLAKNAPLLIKVDIIRLDALPRDEFKQRVMRHRVPLFVRDYFPNREIYENYYRLFEGALEDLHTSLLVPQPPSREDIAKACDAFLMTIHHFLRLTRRCLIAHGMRPHTPLTILRNAYMDGWLNNRAAWEQILQDRHHAQHGIRPEDGVGFMQRLHGYTTEMKSDFNHIKDRMEPLLDSKWPERKEA